MLTELWWRLRDGVDRGRTRFEQWMTEDRHALHAVAACRIGTGLSILGLLLANFDSRNLWVGQASVWAEPARRASAFPEIALLRGVSDDVLLVAYLLTMAAAAAFTLGWRTKAANVVTYVGFIAVVAQNPVVGVQGDNLIRLTLLWLLLMRSADHWSLDARRRHRVELGLAEARSFDEAALPDWGRNALHNTGLLALATQTVIAYTAAGLDKVADAAWREGNALYFTLQLPESRPFPWLSDLVSGSQVGLAVLTYLVLLTQLFFGPLLLNRTSRRIVIVSAIVVSVIFAVLFAAPFSQLAVVAVTVLFVSDETWLTVEDVVLDRVDALADRVGDDVLDVVDRARDLGTDAVDAVVRVVRRR